ncbi:hypothetical protein SHKM778_12100 [Streptomyces sp. KM77-8]|uniref:Aldehyde dehydrogenase domain-containing protein n=1 Tax=Streptomyces haneummycinicus TaxID=3074435 RepID=A0AAT9HBP7_9ACTN
MASAFEYAPAPESRSVVDLALSYGLFIDGEFTDAADGKVFKTVSSTEEVLSEVAEAGEADVDRAVKAARKAFEKWSALPGSERAKYLFRIARVIQERSRELAVLETLDNGKPIKETRDADLPWSPRTSSTTRAGPTSWTTRATARTRARWAWRARSSRGTSPPHAGVEDRPGARDGQHGGPEARRDDPAVRPVLRGHLPSGRSPQGRCQHHHR